MQSRFMKPLLDRLIEPALEAGIQCHVVPLLSGGYKTMTGTQVELVNGPKELEIELNEARDRVVALLVLNGDEPPIEGEREYTEQEIFKWIDWLINE